MTYSKLKQHDTNSLASAGFWVGTRTRATQATLEDATARDAAEGGTAMREKPRVRTLFHAVGKGHRLARARSVRAHDAPVVDEGGAPLAVLAHEVAEAREEGALLAAREARLLQ